MNFIVFFVGFKFRFRTYLVSSIPFYVRRLQIELSPDDILLFKLATSGRKNTIILDNTNPNQNLNGTEFVMPSAN